MLAGKLVVLGICGGIAAYKAAELVSKLVQAGIQVQVVMTAAAREFVAPLTFSTLSGRPVLEGFFNGGSSAPVAHVELARKADLVLVVPATAHTIARLAHGLSDDLLSALVLATRAPVLLAPAMNSAMYEHPATRANLERVKALGYHLIEPEAGWLACREEGAGRLAAVEKIWEEVRSHLEGKKDLAGRRILVTAGGTREAVDPVRFLGNRSSGKMGYALARVAWQRGARVSLVSGPTALEDPPGVEVVRVESAAEMRERVLERFGEADAVLKAAAVADYRPVQVAAQKIKKEEDHLLLELERTPDILAELGRLKKSGQVLVGFAAETEELSRNALHKLRSKNLDLVVANDVTRPGSGFEADSNLVTLYFADGRVEELPCLPKEEVAGRILDAVSTALNVTERGK